VCWFFEIFRTPRTKYLDDYDETDDNNNSGNNKKIHDCTVRVDVRVTLQACILEVPHLNFATYSAKVFQSV
jgi:hypothetical protein